MKTPKSRSPTNKTLADGDLPNLTKLNLVIAITRELAEEARARAVKAGRMVKPDRLITRAEVLTVIQKTLDHMTQALAQNKKLELRNFGVFEVRVRKPRVGRNPKKPDVEVPIPKRAVVRFKAGKELSAMVLRLASALPAKK